MDEDDDIQVYKDDGNALPIAYQSGYYEVKLRISSTDNSLHFGAVPQHVKDLHGLLPLSIKREWVDLTPQDLNEIFAIARTGERAVRLALDKSKEKNT